MFRLYDVVLRNPRASVGTHARRALGFWWFAILMLVAGSNAALADTCVQATAGSNQWTGFGLAPQSDMFSYFFTAKPQQPYTDTLVGLSQGPATDWSQLAAIVRFNSDGYVDVRDGDTYRARSPIRYDYYRFSGYFQAQVDMRRKTYSVWYWSYDGDTWLLLAKDFHFRTQQANVTQLDHFTAEAETGGLDACGRNLETWARVGAGAPQWANAPLPVTTQDARLHFYVRPDAANMDGLIALSQGPQTFWSNLAAIVRFNSNNMIDVRNGDAYQADAAFNYVPGETYAIYVVARISSDPATTPSTYSVSVTEVGTGRQAQIASGYRFRTEQQGITQIDNWVAEAEQGGLTANFWPSPF